MQEDFHYYCIAVLARAAGFSSEDALTIAYASQYVDDATESTQMDFGVENDLKFDPVRTAHKKLDPRATKWSEQKRILIPFHFIPPKPFEPPGWTFDFVTKPGSEFALSLLKEAFKDEKDLKHSYAGITDFKLFRLCRIGIALHTFADTWAHQDFSGRRHKENDVGSILIKIKGDKSKKLEMLDAIPEIGHAQAWCYPDWPFLNWEYIKGENGEEVPRDNTKKFLDAAKTIYELLFDIKDNDFDRDEIWQQIEPKIEELFRNSSKKPEKRSKKWRESFNYMFNDDFKYDEKKWKEAALDTPDENDYDWQDFSKTDKRWKNFKMKDDFFYSPFYHFHKAALLQRNFVLARLQ